MILLHDKAKPLVAVIISLANDLSLAHKIIPVQSVSSLTRAVLKQIRQMAGDRLIYILIYMYI